MKKSKYMERLQAIYDNEINISIDWFWDSGMVIKIGDDGNGYEDENTFWNIYEGLDWLFKRIVELYPDSDFAKDIKQEIL